MKYLLLPILLCCTLATGYSQSTSPQLSSFAIIVSDLDSCVAWYQSIFGLDIRNRMELPEREIRIAILTGEALELELIQLPNSLRHTELLPDQAEGSVLTGLFKIGFRIEDWENWISFLEEQAVEFHGNIVEDPHTAKRMVIIKDPEGNRIQFLKSRVSWKRPTKKRPSI